MAEQILFFAWLWASAAWTLYSVIDFMKWIDYRCEESGCWLISDFPPPELKE